MVAVAVVIVEYAGEERCEGVRWRRWGVRSGLQLEWIPESSFSSDDGELSIGDKISITLASTRLPVRKEDTLHSYHVHTCTEFRTEILQRRGAINCLKKKFILIGC